MFHDGYVFVFMVGCLSCIASGSIMNLSRIKVNFAEPKTNSPKQRILGGEEVSYSEYPFVVAIMRKDNSTSEEYESCSGAVVKANIILTACHCVGDVVGVEVKYFDPRLVTVVAGTENIYEDSPERQVMNARSFQAHWKCKFYEPGTIVETDAALVMLKDSLELGEGVRPLDMVENEPKALQLRLNHQIRMKTVCSLPGYGFSEPDTPTWVLRDAQLQLISDYECRRIFCQRIPNSTYCNHDFGAKNQFCAITLNSTDGATPCKGDSGAPLVCHGYVHGLLIWGSCRPEYPVVMVKGGSALELIKMYSKPKYGDARRSISSSIYIKQNAALFRILILTMHMISVWNMNPLNR